VQTLESIKIPRWLGTKEHSTLELIGFSDASGRGQAAVIYGRIKNGESYKISLISARGNVSKSSTKAVI
jgi:Pao retrotransposon peptidase